MFPNSRNGPCCLTAENAGLVSILDADLHWRLERETARLMASRFRSLFTGAEDEIRTRDPHLGKVMLYH